MIKKIPFVITYDFDGTLAPGNMQEHNFIPELNMKRVEFWKQTKQLAKEQNADEILAYMLLMIQKANTERVQITKEAFSKSGESIKLFPGVLDWFSRINAYGKEKGVEVKHYIISSGLREMIEGTPIAKEFEKIYASGFMYDQNNVAEWPALAVNYTTKTQYLFRINKGSLEVHDNSVINKFVKDEERPVPFPNMVFIGDGDTDIPCMRLVKDKGGCSIAVYKKNTKGARNKAFQLVNNGRASLGVVADYSKDSAIEKAVMAMIDRVVAQKNINDAGIKPE
ncbi:MAG: phosphoserine phosphatase [Gammaproteobacteria bacterium]|nr:MAG: phosphoserine phosphatase [Gammaproteobacteria bacterium]